MKPWLEDLSEEWIPQSTSFSELPDSSKQAATQKLQSIPPKPRSRLPRLRNSSGSFSDIQTRTDAKDLQPIRKSRSALSERTASANNVATSSPQNAQCPAPSSRNLRSTPASPANSVLYNGTVEQRPAPPSKEKDAATDDIPEWRRRLLTGDVGYGDQKDLFSPMGLQSMFKKPNTETDSEVPKPKSKLGLFNGLGTMPSSPPPWPAEPAESTRQSDRTNTRPRAAETEHMPVGLLSEDSTTTKQRENILVDYGHKAPRTASGQIEFENESFSPVYLTTNLKVGDPSALVPNFRGSELAQRLRHLDLSPRVEAVDGPGIRNTTNQSHCTSSFARLQDDTLPEDLPAGTPDLAEVGNFVELRRGGYSQDGSFRRRPLSPSPQPKRAAHLTHEGETLPQVSTPAERHVATDPFVAPPTAPSPPLASPVISPLPETPNRLSPHRNGASNSPLKLFEAHDTFTSNRLHRRLSQLELKFEKSGQSTVHEEISNEDKLLNHNIRLSSVQEMSFQKTTVQVTSQTSNDAQPDYRKIDAFGEGQLDEYQFPEEFSDASLPSSERSDSGPDNSPSINATPPGSRQPLHFQSDGSPKSREPSRVKRQGLTRISNPFRAASRSQSQLSRKPSSSIIQPNPAVEYDYAEGKRGPTSPFKNPTPKRRRTLYSVDGDADLTSTETGANNVQISHTAMQSVIGRKRKDARQDHSTIVADPEVLARRHILRPRNPTPSQRRRDEVQAEILEATEAFILSSPKLNTIREQLESPKDPDAPSDKSKATAIANEIAAFNMNRIQSMKDDSRKRSVTTQDFLDEAVKIMDYIRSKGRPNSGLASLEETESEPGEYGDDNDFPSTPLTFSRPPSREGRHSQWREPNKQELNPQVMSHLQKFQEKESDSFMGSSIRSLRFSRMKGSAPPESNGVVIEQDDIRIIDLQGRYEDANNDEDDCFDSQRQTDGTHPSTGSSMGQTIATSTSRRSEHVATLAPEAVAHLIPEQIAGMSFDRDKNIWVRQKSPSKEPRPTEGNSTTNDSEEDPFGNIPDLTVDETAERFLHNGSPVRPKPTVETFIEESEEDRTRETSRPVTREDNAAPFTDASSVPSKFSNFAWSFPKTETRATSWSDQETRSGGTQKRQPLATTQTIPESDEDEIEHEIKYFEGRDVAKTGPPSRSVRDITISIASQRPLSSQALDKIDRGATYAPRSAAKLSDHMTKTTRWQQSAGIKTMPNGCFSALGVDNDLQVLEHLPSNNYRVQLSMSVSRPFAARGKQNALAAAPSSPVKGDMTFMLSDLPEFTLNQVDECELPERVVVKHDGTKFSKALEDRYALGTAELVKALQDVQPDEPYWEDLREVDLHAKNLTNLHRLDEFCERLEELDVSDNGISQVQGIPFTLRRLQAKNNCLSSLTSWSSLMNLQHLDISNNDIDSLDGLSHLVHLRTLKVDNNKISSLDGIMLLDGLIEFSARGNQLDFLDFSVADLRSLVSVDLRGNRLTEIRDLHGLPQLRYLDLDDNLIDEFPASGLSIEPCTMLKTLRLCRNGTSSLSVEGYFPNLESLYVDGNALTHISGLEHLRYLRTFSAREQLLATDSDRETCVGNLLRNTDIRSLYVSVNPTRSLEISQHLLNLQKLELASMGLRELPDNFGQLTPNIRSINLNFNSMQDLRPLLNIRRLKELLVVGNKLARLRTNLAVLGKMTTLTKLDLRENPLTLRFYAPTAEKRVMSLSQKPSEDDCTDRLVLPSGEQEADQLYSSRLDEETRLRRRVHEMMLATSCRNLQELDGLPFDKSRVLVKDDIWQRLLYLGIIRRSEKADCLDLER